MTGYEVLDDFEVESEEWHGQRRTGIGASDAPAILGLSPWATPLSIYRQKIGVPNEINPDLAYFGHALEPVIAGWVAEKHPEVGVISDGFSARSVEWPWLTAAPDRVALSTDGTCLAEVPLELKTSSAFSKATWDAGVPLYYVAQVQQQIAVLDAPFGWLAVLHGGNSPELHRIERDDEFIHDLLIPATRAFWTGHVLVRNPPEPTTTAEAVSIWPGDTGLDAVEADSDLFELYGELVQHKRAKAVAEAEIEKASLEIQKRLGDATTLVHQGTVLATWKPRAGARRLDTAQLKSDHPELVAAYTHAGDPTRLFLIKQPKEKAA